MLTIDAGNPADLAWAQQTVIDHHYLHKPVHPAARPMVYVIRHGRERLGLVMAGLPHATVFNGWWGKPGLPTQWQVMDLNRIWLDPRIQKGGQLCRPEIVPGFTDRHGLWRPTAASWAIGEVLARIQHDRVSLWPPVYPDQPYHIVLVVSYHDPAHHKGGIYRASGAAPMKVGGDGRHLPNPSGKYGWVWRLPEPGWSWQDIVIERPRTFRLF
jgi:hypothetical protein